MANTSPNLKVNVGADTSQFDKGMRAAKSELRDFAKVSDGAMGGLGDLVGVNTGKVEQFTSAIRGMGRQLGESEKEGTKAFGAMLSGVDKLTVGFAALGIAGIVAGFKALNAEAENFKSTIAGANIELQTQAYIDTYKQAMHDMNAETGKAVAETQAGWQKFWATFTTRLASRTATLPGGTATGAATMGGATPQQVQLQREINAAQDDALRKAERAEQIAGRLYELERQQSDATREVADLDARIASNREIMRDAQYTLNERLTAYRAVLADIEAKSKILLPIEKERTELMDEMVGLTNSTPAQVDAANQQYVRQQTIVKQLTDEKAALLRYANSLFTQENKITGELEAQAAVATQIAQSRQDLQALNLGVASAPMSGAIAGSPVGIVPQTIDTTALQASLDASIGNSLFMNVGIQIDKGKLLDMTREIESTVGSLALALGDSIGGLIGDLVTGGDAWENFSNAAMSAFGDMATAVGKIAIQAGIASLGIKAALETLGPGGAAIAIAAGTALVALGAAVKAGLSNVANGNYSAGAGVASSGYGSGYGSDYTTRELQVNVTGTLQADGSTLTAVLSNTNKKKGYTT